MDIAAQFTVTGLAFVLAVLAIATWHSVRMARIRLDETTTKLNYELTIAQHELNKQQVELQMRQAGMPYGGVRLPLDDAQLLLQMITELTGPCAPADRLRHAIEQAGGV